MHLFTPEDPRPVHFMGVAGAGMSALALMARRRGVRVTGCDTQPDAAFDVAAAGGEIRAGHDPEHVAGARAVIYTAAISPEHPELDAARDAGIPVIKRAEALAQLVNGRTVIGVAGTHGKTTTTAMITEALVEAGGDPTGLVGGRVTCWGGNARLGSDDVFVVEADEYDRSFLALDPSVAIVTNVEEDHLECYGSLEQLEEAFIEFASRAERALVGADDRGAVRVAEGVGDPVWRVGLNPAAHIRVSGVRATEQGSTAQLRLPGGEELTFTVSLPGLHNVRNAAMALGTVYALGADVGAARGALATFSGVSRRFDVLGTHRGITIVDDYAHHPSEIVATLGAARQRFPRARLVAAFQPHLYSRTKALGPQFGIALAVADHVVVAEIYAAREKPLEGVSGEGVAQAVRRAGGRADWVPDRAALEDHLIGLLGDGDVLVVMGAGDITETGHAVADRLRRAAA